jgi:hypothetical protein
LTSETFCRLLNITARVVGLLLLIVTALVVWLVCFSPPGVRITVWGDEVFVSNVMLGEYGKDITEIIVRGPDSHATLCHARCENGARVTRFTLHPGANAVPERCSVVDPLAATTFSLDRGRSYELTIKGDNGFGFTTAWRESFMIP